MIANRDLAHATQVGSRRNGVPVATQADQAGTASLPRLESVIRQDA
jgi:hypothetical protein